MEKNEASERARYVPVLFPESLLKEIDDFRFDNRLPSRAEAIRALITRGLGNRKPLASEKPPRRVRAGD